MRISLDDKGICRGYAIKQTFQILEGKLLDVKAKTKKFLEEAEHLKIKHEKLNEESIIDFIREVAKKAKEEYGEEIMADCRL